MGRGLKFGKKDTSVHRHTEVYKVSNNMTRHFYQVPLWLLTLLDTLAVPNKVTFKDGPNKVAGNSFTYQGGHLCI